MTTIRWRASAITLICAVPLFAAGCSFVQLDAGAEEVEILAAERVTDCDRVGQTRVNTAHRIVFIPRGDRAIEGELDKLARNSAVELGGDTAVRVTEIEEGKARYEIYDCVR